LIAGLLPLTAIADDYFIHITDIHADHDKYNAWWVAFVDMVNGSEFKPKFVLATGDLVDYADTGDNWRALLDPLTISGDRHYVDGECQIPIYFCSGNHDLTYNDCFFCTQETREYERFVGDATYSAVIDPSVFLVALRSGGGYFVRPRDQTTDLLDLSHGEGIRPTDIRFLGATLDSNSSAQSKIVLTHHPYINAAAYPTLTYGTFLNSRDEFLDVCIGRGVDLVLSGHIHEWAHEAGGVWNKDGGPWRSGDGTRFVVTDALKNWYYRKIYLDETGSISAVGPMEIVSGKILANRELSGGLPSSNHPNPFNSSTVVTYTISHSGYVTVDVFNVLGQRVRRLVDEYQSVGEYSIVWDGDSESGGPVSTGLYFCRVKAGDKIDHKKMLLLR